MNIEKLLQELTKRNRESGWENRDIHRLMYSPDLYVIAYNRIKGNSGSRTPGIDGKNRDDYNERSVQLIADDIKSGSYQFKPARRTYILKENGKLRPLGIPTFRDRLVETAMLIILECIFLPDLEDLNSYGFIANRSCQLVANRLRYATSKHTWVIEGDFTGAFDNVFHSEIIKELGHKIKDKMFLNLVKKRLSAGYTEKGKTFKSNKGTPQGGILSPFLFNRAMGGFDRLLNKLERDNNYGSPKKSLCYAYDHRASKLRYQMKKVTDPTERARIKKELNSESLENFNHYPTRPNPEGRKLEWMRYADDWVLLFQGPRTEIEPMLENIKATSATIGVELNTEKTKVGKVTGGFNFLGYRFTTVKRKGMEISKHHRKNFASLGRRCSRTYVNIDPRVFKRLANKGFCTGDCKPSARGIWQCCSDEDIIKNFSAVTRGMVNYYTVCDSGGQLLGRVLYILQYSLIHTLASKHKTSISKIITKYGLYPTKNEATYPKFSSNDVKGCKWSGEHYSWDKVWSSAARLQISQTKKTQCEECGSIEGLENHHLNRMKNLKGSDLRTMMTKAHSRKTITLCTKCHDKRTKQQASCK